MIFGSFVSRLADLLAEYSTSIGGGDEVLFTSTYEAVPLAAEAVRAIVQRGGYPIVILSDEVISEFFYRYAPKEVLEYVPKVQKFIAENIDVQISALSSTHTKYLASISPEKLRLASAARRELTEIFMRRSAEGSLQWVVTAYPTKALAQEAGMSFFDYAEFVFKALKVDRENPVEEWRRQANMQNKIARFLEKVSELRFVGPEMDITFRVEGRKWINDDGKHNMPGGEVFTAPLEDGVEGFIKFTYPAVWRGREVEGVRLKFKGGVVVEAAAEKGEDFLKKMLEVDEGAKRVGELAFGLNYSISRFTKNVLFDEKIGGTMHMALGAAYPECGGKNVSSIHWDMVRDLRGAKVYADGDVVYEDGKFVLEVIS